MPARWRVLARQSHSDVQHNHRNAGPSLVLFSSLEANTRSSFHPRAEDYTKVGTRRQRYLGAFFKVCLPQKEALVRWIPSYSAGRIANVHSSFRELFGSMCQIALKGDCARGTRHREQSGVTHDDGVCLNKVWRGILSAPGFFLSHKVSWCTLMPPGLGKASQEKHVTSQAGIGNDEPSSSQVARKLGVLGFCGLCGRHKQIRVVVPSQCRENLALCSQVGIRLIIHANLSRIPRSHGCYLSQASELEQVDLSVHSPLSPHPNSPTTNRRLLCLLTPPPSIRSSKHIEQRTGRTACRDPFLFYALTYLYLQSIFAE